MALTNEDLQAIDSLLEPIRYEIKSIELTLENETNRNIRSIAKGHLDLSRKLDEALKVENEKEMLKFFACGNDDRSTCGRLW